MKQSPLNTLDELNRRRFMARFARSMFGVGLLPFANQNAFGIDLPTGSKSAQAKNVIYLFMAGGMSQIDTFDPKPGAATQGPVETLRSNVDDISVSQYLPLMALNMDKVAVVRSLTSTQGAHEQGRYFMRTSYSPRGTITHPGLGSWIIALDGKHNGTLPGAVNIGGVNSGAGFLDPSFSPLPIGDPEKGLQNASPLAGSSVVDINDGLELSEFLDTNFHKTYSKVPRVQSYDTLYREAINLMMSRDLEAFNIAREDARLRERYGRDKFGQGVLLARRLIEHGVRFVEVTLGGWDTHDSNFDRVEDRATVLDQALSALLEDLEERDLLDETLVVVATEFGRTPTINTNDGRDHYPKAFTSLIAGGGIKGGTLYGATDPTGSEVIENEITIPDFNATLAHGLGLPLQKEVYSNTGRPFTVAHKGRPIRELFES
ncbi:MAG: DUF1501 domain-containing protein [Opitutales bacterium]|nr:DUF1501 domain-containing protein [Opitutales bacterium]NRA28210.1 DUF1501 domain-containing protein [Opitutales bacterium]